MRVLLADGTRVDVEMQMRVTPELRSRLVYYAARDYAQQLSRGDTFDTLTASIVVVWLDQPLPAIPMLSPRFRAARALLGRAFQ